MSVQLTVLSRRPVRRLALPLFLLLAACEPDPAEPSSAQSAPVVAQNPRRGGENPVIRWNAIAADLMVDPGPVIDSRAFAILQAAVHDAVNGVERRYQPYTADLSSPGASLEAAVATAARDVLVALSPSQRKKIDAKYDAAIARVADVAARAKGVSLGRRAAKANLKRRKGDEVPAGPWPPVEGPITRPVYVPTAKPGDYQFTPPFDAPPLGPIALFPGWGRLEPFVAAEKHPLEGPYSLHSRGYADDLNEVKAIGRLNSTTRTAEQTEIARFWFEEFPTWVGIANSTIRKKGLDAWDAARVLAQFHFAMADAGIACFEGKYRFRFWRPYTAIRRAAEDGNPATDPGDHWLPLLWTRPGIFPPTFLIPPIPEYPSAAATLSAAGAEVLITHLGDRNSFEATSLFLPGVTRRFDSFTAAVKESGRSRVYGGIHFTKAVRDGYRLGRSIGHEVSRSLPPVDETGP